MAPTWTAGKATAVTKRWRTFEVRRTNLASAGSGITWPSGSTVRPSKPERRTRSPWTISISPQALALLGEDLEAPADGQPRRGVAAAELEHLELAVMEQRDAGSVGRPRHRGQGALGGADRRERLGGPSGPAAAGRRRQRGEQPQERARAERPHDTPVPSSLLHRPPSLRVSTFYTATPAAVRASPRRPGRAGPR